MIYSTIKRRYRMHTSLRRARYLCTRFVSSRALSSMLAAASAAAGAKIVSMRSSLPAL